MSSPPMKMTSMRLKSLPSKTSSDAVIVARIVARPADSRQIIEQRLGDDAHLKCKRDEQIGSFLTL